MSKVDLTELGLPKWPQMIVSGKKVTVDQAKEIIFRTEDFYTDSDTHSGGNNHRFNQWYRETAGLERLRKSFCIKELVQDYMRLYESVDMLRDTVQIVTTEYVHNSWGSCAYVGGPHGWCHPSGTISYSDNIGKWPSIEDVQDDWTKLAEAFPFIDLVVTLMNGESGEYPTKPVINFVVKNGKCKIKPGDLDAHKKYDSPKKKRNIEEEMKLVLHDGREQGLPRSWYEEYAERVKFILESLELYGEYDQD